MAESYGSKARPVALDPFQNIVGVHWKKKLDNATHVAFSIILQADGTDLAFHGDTAPDSGTSPAPDGYFGGEYFSSTALRYYSSSISVGSPTHSPWVRVGGEWFSAVSAIDVEGMPVNEVSPFWFDRISLGENERASGVSDVSWNWIDPAGDEMAIPVPGWPLINFKAGGAGVEMNGPYYTGGKFAFDAGSGFPVWLYEAAGPTPRFLENFPPALTVAFLGNTYSVIGAKVVPSLIGTVNVHQPRIGGDPTSPGLLWVLAERVTA